MSEELGYYFHSHGDNLPDSGLYFYDAKLADLITLLRNIPSLRSLKLRTIASGNFPPS